MKFPRLGIVPAALLLAVACAGCDPAPADPPEPQTPVELDPQTVERIQAEFGEVGRLLQQARFDEALDLASAAIAIAPHRIEPYEVLSNWYVQLGRHDQAVLAFERLSTGSTHGLRFLARHQAFSDERETALATLERCITKDANHPGCRLERALLRQAGGAFEGAAEDLRVAYAADSDPTTAGRLVEALRRVGDYAAIGPILDSALEDAPDSSDLLFARARLQLRDRDDAGAEQTLRRVVDLDPTSASALRLLAGVLLRSGQEAEGQYRLGQADLYRDYHAAIRALKQGYAENLHPTGALMIAEVELTIGNYETAQLWLETARAGGAPEPRVAAAQAWTWYALGDLARGDAELARSGGEDDGHANLARAARAARMGNHEQAGNWLRRALESGPNERNFLHRAADLYRSIGDPASAETLRHRATTGEFP